MENYTKQMLYTMQMENWRIQMKFVEFYNTNNKLYNTNGKD